MADSPTSPRLDTRTPPYYSSICTPRSFDDVADFSLFEKQARDARSLNFVLDYGKQAWCTFDVDGQIIHQLVKKEVRASRVPSDALS